MNRPKNFQNSGVVLKALILSCVILERLSITFTADGKRQPAVCLPSFKSERFLPKLGVNSLKAGMHKKLAF